MSHRVLAAAAVLAVLLAQSGGPAGAGQGGLAFDPLRDSLPRDDPQPIYDRDPSHPWNRLFHLLFTRTLQARLAAPGANPFVMAGDDRLALSDRTVTHIPAVMCRPSSASLHTSTRTRGTSPLAR